jgi:hypothetical protein
MKLQLVADFPQLRSSESLDKRQIQANAALSIAYQWKTRQPKIGYHLSR